MIKELSVFILLLVFVSIQPLLANDTGVLEYFLNINAKLPLVGESISPNDAVQAVVERIESIRSGAEAETLGLTEYWSDYKKVLDKYHEVTVAKPVLITYDGKVMVARFLV